ncbi:MAG: MoaD/ThiS family protein [Bacteroidota bacterium]
MKTVNILFLGPLRDITGTPGETLSGLDSLPEILDHLRHKYPGINTVYFQVSLNRNLIPDSQYPVPADEDEIALLPPFAGG